MASPPYSNETRLDRQGNSIRDTGLRFPIDPGQRFAFVLLGFGEIAQLVEQRTESLCPRFDSGSRHHPTPTPQWLANLCGARDRQDPFSLTVLTLMRFNANEFSYPLFRKTRGNGDPLDLKLKFFRPRGRGSRSSESILPSFITTRTTFSHPRPCPPPRNRKSCRRDN